MSKRTEAGLPLQANEIAELQAVYGEHPGRNASAPVNQELSAARGELTEWINGPLDSATRERLRGGLIAAMNKQPETADASAVDLVPINGAVWFRRAQTKADIPCSSIQYLPADSIVSVPPGSRAQLHFGDGSLLLLDEGTELTLQGGAEARAALEHGRVYAWIAKQHSGNFAIRTRHGQVSVLGTEFDLHAGKDDQLRLVVATGRVRFSPPEASAAGGISGSVTLEAGQVVELAKPRAGNSGMHRPEVRSLTPGELRSYTSWSRGMGARPVPGERRTRGRWIGAIVLLLALVGLYSWFGGAVEEQRAATTGKTAASSTPAGVNSRASGSNALAPASSAADAGKVRFIAESETKHGSVYRKDLRVVAAERVHDPEVDGSRLVELIIREATGYGPDGKPLPSALPAGILNKSVLYRVQPDGKVTAVHVPPNSGDLARAFASLARQSAAPRIPFAAATAAKQVGQEWLTQSSIAIPEVPGSRISFTSRVRYEGQQTDKGGNRVDRYSYSVNTSFGGFVTSHEKRNGRELILAIRDRIGVETGTMLADPGTGQLIQREGDVRTETFRTRTTRAENGRGSTQNMKPDLEESRVRITAQVIK